MRAARMTVLAWATAEEVAMEAPMPRDAPRTRTVKPGGRRTVEGSIEGVGMGVDTGRELEGAARHFFPWMDNDCDRKLLGA